MQGGWIADELALHCILGCKGSSGLKPCMLCANVFSRREKRGVVEADMTGTAVHHTEPDHANLLPMTPTLLQAIVNRLEFGEANMNTRDMDELQTRSGWNYDPGLAPRIQRMRPCSTVCFDWMHCIFVGGVFNVHMGAMMKVVKPAGITYAVLHEYICQWSWPNRMSAPSSICDTKRAKSSWEADVFKCTASEGLSALPVCKEASPFNKSFLCVL